MNESTSVKLVVREVNGVDVASRIAQKGNTERLSGQETSMRFRRLRNRDLGFDAKGVKCRLQGL